MKRRGRSDGANEFQSTLPARGATTSSPASCCRRCHFNPRSPHGERLFINSRKSFASGFQSTLPARGATGMNQRLSLAEAFQSTLPARGATTQAVMQASFLLISIHAPRTGSDPCTAIIATFSASFQSTLPARGATILVRQLPQLFPISIHAPRTGSDERPKTATKKGGNFNPRSPHGERHTADKDYLPAEYRISIHAPRTGSDAHTRFPVVRPTHFNPRSPHGERQRSAGQVYGAGYFNPRSPHGERRYSASVSTSGIVFQSTLPARGATFSS